MLQIYNLFSIHKIFFMLYIRHMDSDCDTEFDLQYNITYIW